MLRRVQEERSVGLLYGQRALLIGALDPINYIGTSRHSRYKDQPFKRLAATGRMFETVFFGSRSEADKVLAAVERMHRKVAGEIGEQAGIHPADSRYSADDPTLMLWTIAVAAESSAFFYELLIGGMDEAERDHFWADWVRFGELFGMSADVAPQSWRELKKWFDARLAGNEMHLTEEARRVGFGVAFRVPFRAIQGPLREVHNLLILGSLPQLVRDHYRLGWSAAHQAAYRAAVIGLRASAPITPGVFRRGDSAGHYERIARTEQRLIERGRPPIPLDDVRPHAPALS
jgi:uncharacterized protein (DUF2236 family)